MAFFTVVRPASMSAGSNNAAKAALPVVGQTHIGVFSIGNRRASRARPSTVSGAGLTIWCHDGLKVGVVFSHPDNPILAKTAVPPKSAAIDRLIMHWLPSAIVHRYGKRSGDLVLRTGWGKQPSWIIYKFGVGPTKICMDSDCCGSILCCTDQ